MLLLLGLQAATGFDLGGTVRAFFQAVHDGNYWWAAALVLIAFVGLFRVFGKQLHEFIPDDWKIDRVFYFVLETKVGGWLLNWCSAVAGVLGLTAAAGQPVNLSTWKMALVTSTTSTALFELWKDVREWLDLRAFPWWLKLRALTPLFHQEQPVQKPDLPPPAGSPP